MSEGRRELGPGEECNWKKWKGQICVDPQINSAHNGYKDWDYEYLTQNFRAQP